MEEGLSFLTTYLEEFTYIGIFTILILAGFGLPIPEEIVLVFSGYLAFLEYTKFSSTVLIALLGVLAGDFILFSFGRRWGYVVLNSPPLKLAFY